MIKEMEKIIKKEIDKVAATGTYKKVVAKDNTKIVEKTIGKLSH